MAVGVCRVQNCSPSSLILLALSRNSGLLSKTERTTSKLNFLTSNRLPHRLICTRTTKSQLNSSHSKRGGFGCSVQQNSNSGAKTMPQSSSNDQKWTIKKTAEDYAENHLEDNTENKENRLPISQAASIASPISHEDSSTKPRFSGGLANLLRLEALALGGNVAVQKDGYNDHDGLHLNTSSESTSEKLHSALDECLQTDTILKETNNEEQDNYLKKPDTQESNQSVNSQETVVEHFSDGGQEQEDDKNNHEDP
uniref:Uncharacterized protein n=1 Tax=Ditylenchus dipsaci TaxID=166011 RepID=A0A915CZM0_9BILA